MAAGLALTLTQLLALILAGLRGLYRRVLRRAQHRRRLDRSHRHHRPGAGRVAVQPRLLPGLQRHRLGRRAGVPVAGLDGARRHRDRAGMHDGGDHRRRASRRRACRRRASSGRPTCPDVSASPRWPGRGRPRMSAASSSPTETRSRLACGLASAATGRWVRPGRVLDQGVDAAEGYGVGDHPDGRRDALGVLGAAAARRRSANPARPSGCPTRPVRIAFRQARIADRAHQLVPGQPGGHLVGGGLLGPHPDGKRGEPAVEQVGRPRREDAAGDGPNLAQADGPLRRLPPPPRPSRRRGRP